MTPQDKARRQATWAKILRNEEQRRKQFAPIVIKDPIEGGQKLFYAADRSPLNTLITKINGDEKISTPMLKDRIKIRLEIISRNYSDFIKHYSCGNKDEAWKSLTKAMSLFSHYLDEALRKIPGAINYIDEFDAVFREARIFSKKVDELFRKESKSAPTSPMTLQPPSPPKVDGQRLPAPSV